MSQVSDVFVSTDADCLNDADVTSMLKRLYTGKLQGASNAAVVKVPMVWHSNNLAIVRTVGEGQRVPWAPKSLGEDLGHYVGLVLAKSGKLQIQQGNKTIVLNPGQITIIDFKQAFILDSADANEVFVFHVPLGLLEARGITLDRFSSHKQDAPPLVTALFQLSVWALRAQIQNIEYDRRVIERSLLEMLLSVIATSGLTASQTSRRATKSRAQIVDIIEECFKDQEFGASVLAGELQLSKRQLYRQFEGQQITIASMIRNRRIEHAELLLATAPQLSMTEVVHYLASRPQTDLRGLSSYLVEYSPRCLKICRDKKEWPKNPV